MLRVLPFLLLFFVFSELFAQNSSCPEDLLPRRNLKNGKMGFKDLFDNWKINPKYFEVFPFEGRHAKVRFGNFYGMVNCEGKEVIPPKFEELSFFNHGRLWAKDKNGWFLWDSSGNQLSANPIDEYTKTSIYNQYTWVRKDRNWNIVNEKDGKFLCEQSFTTIKVMSDSLTLVSNDSYYGIINHKTCQFQIPEKIVNAQKVSAEFIKVQYKDRNFDILDRRGISILKEPYEQILYAGNGLARVLKNGKWGIITPKGKIILDLTFDSISTFHSRRIAVKTNGQFQYLNEKLVPISKQKFDFGSDYYKNRAIVSINKKWYIIDLTGKAIDDNKFQMLIRNDEIYFGETDSGWVQTPIQKDYELFEIVWINDKNEYKRVQKDGAIGIYNFTKNEWIINPGFDSIYAVDHNELIVLKSGKFGLCDTVGNKKVDYQYDFLNYEPGFRRNLYIAGRNNNRLLINSKGDELIKEISDLNRQGIYFVSGSEGETKIFNFKGDLLIDEKFDSVNVLDKKRFLYRKKGDWGLMEIDGDVLLKDEFSEVKILSENKLAFKDKDNWQIYNYGGEKMEEELYLDEIEDIYLDGIIASVSGNTGFYNDRLKLRIRNIKDYKIGPLGELYVLQDSKWKIYNSDAELIVENTFDNLKTDSNQILLESNKKWYYLNSKKQIAPFLPFDED